MDWTEIISIAINSLILPILAWGVAELTSFLTKKIENETTEKYVNFAVDAVYAAVEQTMQTYVSALKSSGEWNEESARIALESAKATAIVTMGASARKAIEEATGDLDAWLETRIEAAILEIKGAN